MTNEENSTRNKWQAGLALVKIGSPAVPALTQILSDRSKHGRQNAALALNMIGINAKEATPALIIALKNDDQTIRFFAADTLRQIGTPEILTMLEEEGFDLNFLREQMTLIKSGAASH